MEKEEIDLHAHPNFDDELEYSGEDSDNEGNFGTPPKCPSVRGQEIKKTKKLKMNIG